MPRGIPGSGQKRKYVRIIQPSSMSNAQKALDIYIRDLQKQLRAARRARAAMR